MNFNESQKPAAKSTRIFDEPHSTDRLLANREGISHKNPQKIHSKTPLKWGIWMIAAALAVFVGRLAYHHVVYAGIDTSRYQAVYLTNDNVYFGKTHIQVNGDIFLTDVFRVQTTSKTGSGDSSSASTSSDSTTGEIRLIKPGKELHAPDDTMLIRRSNVLFIENLKTEGNVTQAIIDYHKQNTSK